MRALEPFGLGRVALRQPGLLSFLALLGGQGVGGGLGQPLLDGGDRGFQADDVTVLRVAREPILGVVAGDDRIGPPRTRLRRQRLLAGVEPVPPGLAPGLIVQRRGGWLGPAGGGQVRTPQRAQMIGNQVEHLLVFGRGPQPRRDRRAGGAGHGLHPTPFPQFHRRHEPIIPRRYDNLRPVHYRPTNRQPFSTRAGATPRIRR
jgi:hypothetical protein